MSFLGGKRISDEFWMIPTCVIINFLISVGLTEIKFEIMNKYPITFYME